MVFFHGQLCMHVEQVAVWPWRAVACAAERWSQMNVDVGVAPTFR